MNKVMLSNGAANAAADAVGRLCDGGWLDIYEGEQPDTGDAPLPEGTKLLASLQFGTPAFLPATGGAARAAGLSPDRDAAQTGRPAWFRLYRADHETRVYDGDVGRTPEAAMVLRALLIAQHAEVAVTEFVLTMPKSS